MSDGIHKRGDGEEAYAQVFQFKDEVNRSDQDEIRDFLYKIAFNLEEAYAYLELLKSVDAHDKKAWSELIFRINGMSLQCFALAIRRLTDRRGKRSLQKFTKFLEPDRAKTEGAKFETVYSHYEDFINKGIAHQDDWSTKEIFESFPDTHVIDSDLQEIEEFYIKITQEMCSKYAKIVKNDYDYSEALNRLVSVRSTDKI